MNFSPVYRRQMEHPDRHMDWFDFLYSIFPVAASLLGNSLGFPIHPRGISYLFPRSRRTSDRGVPDPHRSELHPVRDDTLPD